MSSAEIGAGQPTTSGTHHQILRQSIAIIVEYIMEKELSQFFGDTE